MKLWQLSGSEFTRNLVVSILESLMIAFLVLFRGKSLSEDQARWITHSIHCSDIELIFSRVRTWIAEPNIELAFALFLETTMSLCPCVSKDFHSSLPIKPVAHVRRIFMLFDTIVKCLFFSYT